jgi:hypothetical protein
MRPFISCKISKGVISLLLSILANTVATLAIFPLISFVFLYFGISFWTRNKQLALQWSINITTVLILISVPLTLQQLWGVSLLWLIILVIAVIVVGLAYLQYAVHDQFIYDRLFKGIVRLTFLFFLPIHIILYLWVVVRSVLLAM